MAGTAEVNRTAGSPSSPILCLKNVGVQFAGVRALHGIEFDVNAAERVAVIGPNGAGKSTLFSAISGEVRATSGCISLFGDRISRQRPNALAAAGLGRTYQTSSVFKELTVAENVQTALQGLSTTKFRSWWPLIWSNKRVEQVRDILDKVQLGHRFHVKAGTLSHGEQRQLELALALVVSPRLLLLDEPAAGLSASERVVMRSLLEGLPDDITLLLIEHDMSLALELVSRVVCLSNGELVADGTPEEIKSDQRVRDVYLGSEDARD